MKPLYKTRLFVKTNDKTLALAIAGFVVRDVIDMNTSMETGNDTRTITVMLTDDMGKRVGPYTIDQDDTEVREVSAS